jgi:DNA-binding NarL/FixJ family response regulator
MVSPRDLRFVIADDHPMIRETVKAILEVKQFQVAGVASDGREAVRLCRVLEPDMAVLDLSMPQLNGIDAAREIKRASPDLRIIVLSTHSDGPYILESLRVGVAGYVTKAKAASHLPEAIDAVCRGEIYVRASGSQRCMEAFLVGPEGRDSFFGELWEQEALRHATKPGRSSPPLRKQVANWSEPPPESSRDVPLTRSTMCRTVCPQLRSPFVGQRAVQAQGNQYSGHVMNGVILRKHPVPVSRPTTCRLCASL